MPVILVHGRLRQENDYYLEQPGLQNKILCHAYTGQRERKRGRDSGRERDAQLEVTEAPCPSVGQ